MFNMNIYIYIFFLCKIFQFVSFEDNEVDDELKKKKV